MLIPWQTVPTYIPGAVLRFTYSSLQYLCTHSFGVRWFGAVPGLAMRNGLEFPAKFERVCFW